VAICLGVVVALAAAGYGLWNSSWLKLHTVQVVGIHHTTRAQVVGAAALVDGTRLTDISSATVAHRVEGLPWVATAVVTHVLPSTVRIAVTERVPDVVVQEPDRSYLVDAHGAVLQAGNSGYPLVTGITTTATVPGDRITTTAFTAAIAVLQALPPSLAAQLAQINAASADRITVGLTNQTTIVYGTADDLAAKNADVIALLGTGKNYTSINVEASDHPAALAR
jgi:cell division protein FtsQ